MTDDPRDHEIPARAKFRGELAAENWDELKRPRGLFTDTDRQFLWGVKTYEDSAPARSHRRRDIRERVKNGLLDFSLLPRVEPELRERVIRELEKEYRGELRAAVADLVRFLYQGVDDPERWLEIAVETGISNAINPPEGRPVYASPADVDIQVSKPPDLDSLEEQFQQNPGTLSDEEVGVLIRAGRVSPDDVEQFQQSVDENV